jgi:hypothetical protein
MKTIRDEKGIVLLGVIVLMVAGGIFLAASSSVLFTAAGSNLNVVQGTQALAIAQAGSQWYKEMLRGDNNWTDEADQTVNFAGGNFTISILSRNATEVRFRSTGTVGAFVRFEEWTAQKSPGTFKFALFQSGTGNLNFDNSGTKSTRVFGEVWSAGNVQINSPNQVTNGTVYVPVGKDVTGSGTYTEQKIAAPVPAMPAIDTSSYDAVMTGFDALIAANTSTADLNLTNATLNVSGVMNYRNVVVRGNSEIRGNGTIVARSIDIGTTASAIGTTIFILPFSGTLNFVAERDLEVGSSGGLMSVIANGRTNYYSRANGRSIRVLGANNLTSIENGKFYARNNIEVKGAVIFGKSLLYLAGGAGSGQITLRESNTGTQFLGNIISLSNAGGAIDIKNSAGDKGLLSVNGIVYNAGTGTCKIENARITGSVVCRGFNELSWPDIYYAASNDLPAGFEGQVSFRDNSWDGS